MERCYKLTYSVEKLIVFVSHIACHILGEAFIESINEDDYKNVVFQVITTPEKKSHENSGEDILELICKIYKTLEDSPVTILPFINSCTRNANQAFFICY